MLEWTLVFKAISGNGERVYDAWKKDLSKLSSCDAGLGCLSEDDTINTISPTSRHLTSELIKQWTSINVQKVCITWKLRNQIAFLYKFSWNYTCPGCPPWPQTSGFNVNQTWHRHPFIKITCFKKIEICFCQKEDSVTID